MAEQRQFLLDQAKAPYALFLDDDVILEPDILARMLTAIKQEGCGFVGCPATGLSYLE
ncbi:MAG: glycosyl transferase, partial [Chloroflexota bacterium]